MSTQVVDSVAAPRQRETATRAGAGWSENPNSRQAGTEAARMALQRAGVDQCDLALIFQTGKHDPRAFLEGVRSVIPAPARLLGGYSVGIITNDFIGCEGHQVGVAVIKSDRIKIDLFMERGLDDSERDVGVRLGQQIRGTQFEGEPNLLFMYDSVKQKNETAMTLNMATPLLEGMTEALEHWPRAAGVGMFGELAANPTWQFFDDQLIDQSALAVVLHGGVRMDTIIMHGCKPSGAYHTITKAEGPVILEIDGKPALDAIVELMGPDRSWEEFPLFVTLGVNRGDKFGEFREQDYANRLCMAVDRERKAIIMFEPDLQAGTEVQIMRRSIDFEYIGPRVRELIDRVGERKPIFAFYIDCAGRAAMYSGTEREEAEEVQKAMGNVPLLGMYSGVEIAKFGEDVVALDWTGVLCLFSE